MSPRAYTRYAPETIVYLRLLYAHYSLTQLAQLLDISTPRKVYDLARAHGIRKRAFNGAPQWRDFSKSHYHQPLRWAA